MLLYTVLYSLIMIYCNRPIHQIIAKCEVKVPIDACYILLICFLFCFFGVLYGSVVNNVLCFCTNVKLICTHTLYLIDARDAHSSSFIFWFDLFRQEVEISKKME